MILRVANQRAHANRSTGCCQGSRELFLEIIMRRRGVQVADEQLQRLSRSFFQFKEYLSRGSAGLDRRDRQRGITVIRHYEAKLPHILFMIKSDGQRLIGVTNSFD